jgi:uncharacterized protein
VERSKKTLISQSEHLGKVLVTNDSSSISREASSSCLRAFFMGPDGLRAGWSALIFCGVSVAQLILIRHIFDKHSGLRTDEIPLSSFFLREASLLCGTLMLTWVMSKVERRRFSIYGLDGSRRTRNLIVGAVWGIACVSLLVFVLHHFGLLVLTPLALHGTGVIRYTLAWIIVFFIVGVFEETFSRGFLLYTLSRGLSGLYGRFLDSTTSHALGFWSASVIIAALFMLAHTNHPGESLIGLFAAFAASLAFSVSIWRTGSLWWIIGFHGAWDWSQSFLYGVGDSGVFFQHRLLSAYPSGSPLLSGGATGPEGSIFVLPALLLTALVCILTQRDGGYEAKLAAAVLQHHPSR